MSDALTKFVAVARVDMDSSGEEASSIISWAVHDKADPALKTYRKHATAVVRKAASKMQEGKRIRLVATDYELYISPTSLENEPDVMLAYVAIVDKDFGAAHTISKLMDELKTDFLAIATAKEILKAKGNSALHKKAQKPLMNICEKFGTNKILAISAQVDQVKDIMTANIDAALANSASIDQIADSADHLVQMGEGYKKGAKKTRRNACLELCKARAMCFGAGLTVVGIIALVIFIMTSGGGSDDGSGA